MQIIDRIAQIHGDLTNWRRDIHAHPELGFEEQRTSDLVAAKLAEFGCEVYRGIGKTGVVGRLRDDAIAFQPQRSRRANADQPTGVVPLKVM